MTSQNYKKAVTWILLWSAVFSTSMSFAKTLSAEIHGASLIFCRLAFGFAFMMPVLMTQGIREVIQTNKRWLHVARGAILFTAMGCTYYAYRNLPLAQAATIGQSGPLFTTVLSILILKERISFSKWIALIIGYIGVLFIIKPAEGELDAAVLIALLANLLAGFGIVTAKLLSSTERSQTILFYTTGAALILSTVGGIYYWHTPSSWDLAVLIIIGGAGTFSQYCYLQALKYAPASFVTPFEYSRLCFSVPIGVYFFNEIPDTYMILGSLIIITSIIILVRGQTPQQEKSKDFKSN